jgi:tRNA (adenine22-N1)-methyltransferase
MRLNGRLKMIADQIPKCGILADIGTDHAFIPIYVVKNGICEKALAADLRTGPLEMASKNIKKHGLSDKIQTRMGDGLEPILPNECEVVVIAGMGGALIRDILAASVEKAMKARLLLLQANTAVETLRRWLYENGFIIEHEHLALDAGKCYVAIESRWTGHPEGKDEFTYFVGEKIFEGNEAHLQRYLRKKLREVEVIIEGRSRSDPSKMRIDEDSNSFSTENCILIRDKLKEYLRKTDFIDRHISNK